MSSVSWLFRSHAAIFFLGVASAGAVKVLLPTVGKAVRPIAKEAIKGGVVLGREVQAMAESVKEEIEDMAAEAVSETAQTTPEGGSATGRAN